MKGKIKTTAEVLLLVEWGKASRRGPGGVIKYIRNGYNPPKLIPQKTLFAWVTKLKLIATVCGHETADTMSMTNGEVIIGPQRARVKDSELTPESIVFKDKP